MKAVSYRVERDSDRALLARLPTMSAADINRQWERVQRVLATQPRLSSGTPPPLDLSRLTTEQLRRIASCSTRAELEQVEHALRAGKPGQARTRKVRIKR